MPPSVHFQGGILSCTCRPRRAQRARARASGLSEGRARLSRGDAAGLAASWDARSRTARGGREIRLGRASICIGRHAPPPRRPAPKGALARPPPRPITPSYPITTLGGGFRQGCTRRTRQGARRASPFPRRTFAATRRVAASAARCTRAGRAAAGRAARSDGREAAIEGAIATAMARAGADTYWVPASAASGINVDMDNLRFCATHARSTHTVTACCSAWSGSPVTHIVRHY